MPCTFPDSTYVSCSPDRRPLCFVHRNFHYITILRDPVSRYLSEWRHVQRGATGKLLLHVCETAAPNLSKSCPAATLETTGSGCPLKEFMDCPYNLANNPGAHASDLTLVGCYNLSVMLRKAEEQGPPGKCQIESEAHGILLGLTELQRKTQYLFEKTFNMNFISPFTQYNTTRASSEKSMRNSKTIEGLNFLIWSCTAMPKISLQRYQFMRQKEHQKLDGSVRNNANF